MKNIDKKLNLKVKHTNIIAEIGIKHILNQSARSIKHKPNLIGIKYVDFFIDASNATIQNGKTKIDDDLLD
jgi:hypothetical protein